MGASPFPVKSVLLGLEVSFNSGKEDALKGILRVLLEVEACPLPIVGDLFG